MAKLYANNDSNELSFERLEIGLDSMESMIGLENDEQIQRLTNDSNDSQMSINTNNRRINQRNRNYYYCNNRSVHHSHHQHLHHMTHHSTHNHNNRINTHSNCNQQEMGVNDESSQESHSRHVSQHSSVYTLNQSEFERIWRQLESNKDRYKFLRSLYRSSPSGNLVFSEISFGSLGDIASALYEFDDTVDDFCFVVYILSSLSRAKRFLLSLQFLTTDERVECKKLFNKLWKSMNDKQQDLAENDISELTINHLIKSYECHE